MDASGIALVRGDGTTVELDQNRGAVWCAPWEGEEVPARTLHLWVGASADDFRTRTEEDTFNFWKLNAVAEHVQVGVPHTFPNAFVWNEPRGVHVFVADVQEGNELSSAEEESAGTLTFEKFGCEPGSEVVFNVDAVLGSELNGPKPATMKGTFRGRVMETAPF